MQRLDLDRKHGWKIPHNGAPIVSRIRRRVHLAAGRAEIHATLIERIDRHRIAQHVYVAVVLRQTLRERFPLVSSRAATVHAQFSLGWKVLRVALDRDHIDGLRLVRVHVDHEPEVGGQVAADLVPRIAGVIAAHDIPMFLHEQRSRTRPVHRNPVHAVADFGRRFRHNLGVQPFVDRPPRRARVVSPEHARR